MSATLELNAETIAAVDRDGQLADIMAMPEHLGDALWRVQSASLESHDSPDGLVVAGMGGSAIGGALARAALGDRASRPIVMARGYALPAWTTPDTTVLCSSYSGETEETLAIYEAAKALGARQIVATTGGALAEAARADGDPGDPAAGRLSAPRRGGVFAGRRARGRVLRAGPASTCTARSTSPPPTLSSWPRPGDPTAPKTHSPRRWPAGCTARSLRSQGPA